MMPICPAGPPKLMKPSLSQNQIAWPNETVGAMVVSFMRLSGFCFDK
jgi:hypothetical protein